MSNAYYYFSASLPYITLESTLPLTEEKFIQDCQGLLSGEDFYFIAALLSDDNEYRPSTDEHQLLFDVNRNFQNLVTQARAEHRGKDASDFIRGYRFKNEFINNIVNQALKETNLMKAQQMLDQAYWNYLDDAAMGHYNDIVFIGVYGLKIKILKRYEDARTDLGQEVFEKIKMIGVAEQETARS